MYCRGACRKPNEESQLPFNSAHALVRIRHGVQLPSEACPWLCPGLWPGVTTARSAEMPDDISEANELGFFTYFYKVRLGCIVTSERRCCH